MTSFYAASALSANDLNLLSFYSVEEFGTNSLHISFKRLAKIEGVYLKNTIKFTIDNCQTANKYAQR